MAKAFVGFGTNMGDRNDNICAALESLNLIPNTQVISVSQIYETKPWGYLNQPNFLNGVAEVETSLSPSALLGALLGIEAAMGRIRTIKNGPRVIDLDLLMYDNIHLITDELVLPHPRMMERAFVLKPLIDLNPKEEFISALNQLDETQVWLYEK